MSHPRGLSEEEAAAWEKLAATVQPLPGTAPRVRPPAARRPAAPATVERTTAPATQPRAPAARTPSATPASRANPRRDTLDGHWNRKLKSGSVEPDYSLDLHGHTLDAAYRRLMDGMAQARGLGARVVLVVTGKPRLVDAADRGTSRGAIRAKILDWLAASDHGDAIAAVRTAHRRHGGDGALYLVLRRN